MPTTKARRQHHLPSLKMNPLKSKTHPRKIRLPRTPRRKIHLPITAAKRVEMMAPTMDSRPQMMPMPATKRVELTIGCLTRTKRSPRCVAAAGSCSET